MVPREHGFRRANNNIKTSHQMSRHTVDTERMNKYVYFNLAWPALCETLIEG